MALGAGVVTLKNLTLHPSGGSTASSNQYGRIDFHRGEHNEKTCVFWSLTSNVKETHLGSTRYVVDWSKAAVTLHWMVPSNYFKDRNFFKNVISHPTINFDQIIHTFEIGRNEEMKPLANSLKCLLLLNYPYPLRVHKRALRSRFSTSFRFRWISFFRSSSSRSISSWIGDGGLIIYIYKYF